MAKRKREIYDVDEVEIRENSKDDNQYNFSIRLNEILKQRGIHQDMLCKEAEISTGALSNYRNGLREPSISNLRKLSDYLNLSTDYLLCRTDDIKGNANVMAVEKRLGLTPKAQKVLESAMQLLSDPKTQAIEQSLKNHIVNNVPESPLFRDYNRVSVINFLLEDGIPDGAELDMAERTEHQAILSVLVSALKCNPQKTYEITMNGTIKDCKDNDKSYPIPGTMKFTESMIKKAIYDELIRSIEEREKRCREWEENKNGKHPKN